METPVSPIETPIGTSIGNPSIILKPKEKRGRYHMIILSNEEIKNLTTSELLTKHRNVAKSIRLMEDEKRNILLGKVKTNYELDQAYKIRQDYCIRLGLEKERRSNKNSGALLFQQEHPSCPVSPVSPVSPISLESSDLINNKKEENNTIDIWKIVKPLESKIVKLLNEHQHEMKVEFDLALMELRKYIQIVIHEELFKILKPDRTSIVDNSESLEDFYLELDSEKDKVLNNNN